MIKLFTKKIFKRNMDFYEINMEELKQKQKNGAQIVDVRSLQEFNEGHLQGAINIPYYEIRNSINNILKNKEQEIVLYCETGARSKQAYKKMLKMQYKNVYNLHGGLEKWT